MHFSTSLLLTLVATATALPSEHHSKRASSSNTANDVTNKAPCGAVTVIFARGTSESGNIGSVIGPKLQSALKTKLGAAKVNYQGVPYPATWAVCSHHLFLVQDQAC